MTTHMQPTTSEVRFEIIITVPVCVCLNVFTFKSLAVSLLLQLVFIRFIAKRLFSLYVPCFRIVIKLSVVGGRLENYNNGSVSVRLLVF